MSGLNPASGIAGPHRNVAAAGMLAGLPPNFRSRMLRGMSGRSGRRDSWESYFGERRRPSVFRSFKRLLALERRYTEKLLNGRLLAINAEIDNVEHRIMAKLEEIDASLNLIAREIARRGNDPPSKDVDCGH